LAAMLDLREPTISQHLMMLKHFGFVNVRPDGNHRIYSYNNQALIGMSKEVFSREGLASLVKDFEEVGDAWERKVLKTFFEGDRLIQFPASDKKMQVIIKWLADKFEEGTRYTEKEVNEILTRYNPDYATLRRQLIEYGHMQRDKGIYWRVSVPRPEPEAE
jgi:hypothetical protein